jgi:hypothetical protein
MRDVADAVHVDYAMILADFVERALQLADHAAALKSRL